MPNWVTNEVEIKASEKDLRAFADKHIVDGKFDFATIVPIDIPLEEYHGTEEIKLRDGSIAYTGGEWYEWNIEHWGTKWNAHETHTEDFTDNGGVYFLTAWSQPVAIMDALAKMYPTFVIEWKYIEEQGWGGVCYYENGRELRTQRRSWDIPSTHDERMEIFEYCFACEDGDEEDMEAYGCPSFEKERENETIYC